MGEQLPAVSVIVAAYNSDRFLPGCLDSLKQQSFGDFETIVVNSSPETRTAEVMSAYPEVRFFQSPQRLFPHAARNTGVSLARGRLFAFTDADCQADPNWLAELVAAYAAGHEIVGGCIDSRAERLVSRAIYVLKYSPYQRGLPAGPIPMAATGSLLVSRRVLELVGGFDGSIFCGDALLSWQARAAGFLPWFQPQAIVTDQDELYRWRFLAERFTRGREYGRIRAVFENWSRLRQLLRICATPLALGSALLTIGRHCQRGSRLGDFLKTFPFLCVAQGAWCLGEAFGYQLTSSQDDAGSQSRG
jgi:glycosyltransferase involved in cell wall biosynthesis